MLQNRVNPLGDIIKTAARGSWMGNRGILHNDQQEVLRPFKSKAWITCKLKFKERKRQVMAPHRYTELFFLDEATSFAAGHRPCFECRREDYHKFKSLWLKGNPEYHFDEKTSIKKIDAILHNERINRGRSKVTYGENISSIPDGTFILIENNAYLVFDKKIYLWSPFGYDKGISLPNKNKVAVLTPKTIVNTFRAGYIPHVSIPFLSKISR